MYMYVHMYMNARVSYKSFFHVVIISFSEIYNNQNRTEFFNTQYTYN